MSRCWYCNNELITGDNQEHFGICNKCYDEMFKTGDTIIRSLTNKIAKLKRQLEEKEKRILWLKEGLSQCDADRRFEQKKKNLAFKKLTGISKQLKSQPAEIVDKIGGEIYTRMVVECKETHFADISLILYKISKEYQK